MDRRRKLVAAAIGGATLALPAFALAQSSVQVYGTVHMTVNSTRFSSDTANAFPGTRKWGVNSHSSNWGLRSTESLGGGLTAWFQAEFNMKMERDNGVNDGDATARNSGLGLRGSFGNIYVGTWETPWAQTFRLWDVGTIGPYGPTTSVIGRRETTGGAPSRNCGNLQGSGGGAVGIPPSQNNISVCGYADAGNFLAPSANSPGGYPLWRRFAASVHYESPIWSGVQFKLSIQPNESKATAATAPAAGGSAALAALNPGAVENPSAWSASLAWTGMGGRARAFIANMRAKDFSSVGNTDSGWTAGGGYDFGPVNLGATYERYTYKIAAGDVRARQWGVGMAIPVGPGKIGASYARARDFTGALSVDNGAKMWNLGYEWALSKRTALGFGLAKIDNDSGASFTWTSGTTTQNGITNGNVAGLGSDVTNLFVSMRHSF